MSDALDNDAVAAATFRRLVAHLQHRADVQNVDLMGAAGFCRNCLADWLMEASKDQGQPIDPDAARQSIYGIPYQEWKSAQPPATAEQLARMEQSVALNQR